MRQYLDLVKRILDGGVKRLDRTGVGTLALFGEQLVFDMTDGFPLMTTKALNWRLPLAEIIWMLNGGTNVKELHALGAKFWDKWADPETGDLGRVYGAQWVGWRKYVQGDPGHPEYGVWYAANPVDQVAKAVRLLREDPYSRRILVSAWNPAELDQMALPPCPYSHQLLAGPNGDLSMVVNWRSVDVGLGLPFDIAGHAFLLHMYAAMCGRTPWRLVCHMADTHVYLNHIEALREQALRDPLPLPELTMYCYPIPASMSDWRLDQFKVVDLVQQPAIRLEANL